MIIKKIINRLNVYIDFHKDLINIKKTNKKIYLLGAPLHGNLGDHAQTYCSQKWFEKNYPEFQIITLSTMSLLRSNWKLLNIIIDKLNDNDLIFLHSGYHTTDIYPYEEELEKRVVKYMQNNKIILLPQTIHFINKDKEKEISDIFNAHNNLTILCRDEISFATAKKIFANCKLELFPDIVTTMIGLKEYPGSRAGILFCMRNDIEAFYSSNNIDQLIEEYKKYGRVDRTDTTIDADYRNLSKNREVILEKTWKEYSEYKLIITDRYHGTIFSIIAGTPVIVLGTTDHKLVSGVKWFPKQYRSYVKFAENLDEVEGLVEELINNKSGYKTDTYFNDNYYDHLFDVIEGETDGDNKNL